MMEQKNENEFLILKNYCNFLIDLGYKKVSTVRENCEFSIRGDILDLFNNGDVNPIRLYFNDDIIEKIYFLPCPVGGQKEEKILK